MGFGETFKSGLLYLFIAAFCGAVVIGFCAYLYPFVAGAEDPTGFARTVIMRSGLQTLGNLCLMAGLLFANLILPGDFLAKTSESPSACAAVLAAVALVLGYINA